MRLTIFELYTLCNDSGPPAGGGQQDVGVEAGAGEGGHAKVKVLALYNLHNSSVKF